MAEKTRLVKVIAILVITVVAAWCVYYPMHELKLKSSPLQFSISAGSSLRGAAQQMVEAGVLDSALAFELLTRVFGNPKNIKAGNYEVDAV